MAKSATIVDVAKAAGVSLATVSRVLNNEDHVRPEKRERVLQAMSQLGYTVNQQARSLRGGRSNTVGLVVRDLGSGYVGEIVRGIDQELDNANYDLVLYTTHRSERRDFAHMAAMTRGLIDGLLLVLPRDPSAYVRTLRQRQFPYVVIDHQGVDGRGPAVRAQHRQGAYDATRYLIRQGHRRIGFIAGPPDIFAARERLEGYKAALRDAGLPIDPLLVHEGDFFQPRGYSAAVELLALAERPTAIFAANDLTAFGVMEAARDHGLKIPGDISIVGFDDIPQATHVHPALTTVHQPLEEMGRLGARLLLELIDDPNRAPEIIDAPTELIVRATTRSLRVRLL